jgi:hypothetical protein
MASPFTVFRKHRKAYIAALTIMTMFGFVFIPMILDTWRGSSGQQDQVAVTTKKYGKLKQSKIAQMQDQRRRVSAVLQEALQSALYPELVKNPQVRMRAMYRNLQNLKDNEAMEAAVQAEAMVLAQEESRERVKRLFGDDKQEDVVDSWLLARRAEDLGMEVSNAAVNQFLKQFTHDSVKTETLAKLLARQNLSQKQFFALLRNELLALRFRETFISSIFGTTPAQRWDYFSRLNRQATIEALPVSVADYVGEVENPDDKTVRAFFEAHKDDFDLPSEPLPGFRQPERVNVRYFRLVPSEIAKSISAEAIKTYYEKNKESLDRRFEALNKKTEEKKPGDKKPEDKKTEDKKTEEKKTEEKKTGVKESGVKEPEDKKTELKEPEDKKTEDKKPEPKEPEVKEPESKEMPESDKTSALHRGSPFQLTSLLQEGSEADKTAEKTDDKTVEKTADKTEEKPEKEPAEKPDMLVPEPVPGKPGEEKPSEPKEEPGKEKKPDVEIEPMIPELIMASKERWIEATVRRELADQQLQDAIEGLQAEIKRYGDLQRNRIAHPELPTPPLPNFEALAAKFGATTDETGMMARSEMKDLDIAKSSSGNQAFAAMLYADRSESSRAQMSLYQVGITQYQGASTKTGAEPEPVTYVFYKTAEKKERFADWDQEEIREQAKTKWKEVAARKLALAAATALSEKARGSKETLKEAFPGKVKTPAPFTWMTKGAVGRITGRGEPSTISKVAGIDSPGDDFMRTVFDLSPDKVGVAMNHPKTVAYVIRLEKLAPSEESLRITFELSKFEEYGDVAGEELEGMYRAWMEEIKTDAGLKWEIAPDRPAAGSSSEE